MDPIVGGAIAELIAAAVCQACSVATAYVRDRDKLDPVALLPELGGLQQKISESLGSAVPAEITSAVEEFLSSLDFENLVVQLLLIRAPLSGASDNEAMAREFSAVLSLFIPDAAPSFGALLFRTVVDAVDDVLAREDVSVALSADAHRERFELLVRDHLGSISRNLELLVQGDAPTASALIEFQRALRQQIEHRHRSISPRTLAL